LRKIGLINDKLRKAQRVKHAAEMGKGPRQRADDPVATRACRESGKVARW
jgi:hypothetical protein